MKRIHLLFSSLFLLVPGILISGCAMKGLDDLFPTGKTSPKSFQVRNVWVKDLLSAPNNGFRKINRMSTLIYENLLIQGNGVDGIGAYDVETGDQKWKVLIPNGVEAPAIVFKEFLYVGGNDGKFYSIHAKDGKVEWVLQTKTENLGAPSLDSTEGVLYFQTGLSTLYAVEASTGRIIWTYARQDTNQFSIRGNSQPTVHGDLVLNCFNDGSLVAFQKKSGSVVWEVFLNRNKRFKDIDATPVVDGENVFVQAFDDQLYSVSIKQGLIQWKSPYGGYFGVVIDRDRMYISTSNNEVVALDKKSGDMIWKYNVKNGMPTQVRLYKGLIVFGESNGHLRFLRADSGKNLASFEPGRGILNNPAVDETKSRVYFTSNESNLYSIEANWSEDHQLFPRTSQITTSTER